MKTTASALAMTLAFTGALLISGSAAAQEVPPPPNSTAQPPAGPSDTQDAPSSNRWESLPQMSADRCLAAAVGTATDPKTGAPARTAVDPKTGQPLCPPVKPDTDTKPPR